jgi:hypothetical protein
MIFDMDRGYSQKELLERERQKGKKLETAGLLWSQWQADVSCLVPPGDFSGHGRLPPNKFSPTSRV